MLKPSLKIKSSIGSAVLNINFNEEFTHQVVILIIANFCHLLESLIYLLEQLAQFFLLLFLTYILWVKFIKHWILLSFLTGVKT